MRARQQQNGKGYNMINIIIKSLFAFMTLISFLAVIGEENEKDRAINRSALTVFALATTVMFLV